MMGALAKRVAKLMKDANIGKRSAARFELKMQRCIVDGTSPNGQNEM
jgi:hypothetical protein